MAQKQMHIRLSDETRDKVGYWAAKKDVSVNEFISDSIDHYIAWLNGDFQLPTLEVQRFNQLIEHIDALDSSIKNEQEMIAHGFNSLLGLTRGDNYLLEQDSGEL